jgi:hypothetical protein
MVLRWLRKLPRFTACLRWVGLTVPDFGDVEATHRSTDGRAHAVERMGHA